MKNVYQGGIRLVLFDVDGVLTDGSLHLGALGEEVKIFNAKDGVAVALLKSHGISTGVLSGKASDALDYRVSQLKLDLAITGRSDKLRAYSQLKRDLCLDDREIVFVGDDVIDLPVIRRAALSYAPADAHELVRWEASHITRTKGGKGVAREVAEHLLQLGGLTLEEAYAPLLNKWSTHDVQQ